MTRFLLYLFLVSVLTACSGTKSYQLSLQKTVLLNTVAGGSGIVLHGSKAIIISDNVPGFFVTDTTNFIPVFFPFYPGASAVPQDKKIKEDFENATVFSFCGKSHVIAIGSGSVQQTRENILYFPSDSLNAHTILPAPLLYKSLRYHLGINTAQVNIEGSFCTADSFYLLNRGSNHLAAMSLPALHSLLNFSSDGQPFLNTRSYSLPMVDSFPMAFSGACYYKDDRFLFTATVEKTSNWIDDGEVAGSWIGMASLDGNIKFLLPLKDDKGNMVKQKLESIDILKEYSNGDIALLAIADNDNGQSTLLQLLLKKE